MIRKVVLLALSLATVTAWAVDTRHPLTAAVDFGDNLALVNKINPSHDQMLVLIDVCRSVQQLTTDYDRSHEEALRQNQRYLAEERLARLQDTPLAAPSLTILNDLHESETQRRQRYYAAVDDQLTRLHRNLNDDQRALVDWSFPPDAPRAIDQKADLDDLRELAGRLADVGRLLQAVRPLAPNDYFPTRIGRADEYLREYYEPGTRDFLNARDFLLQILDEGRMVSEADWSWQAPVLQARVLQYIGLLETVPGDDEDNGGNGNQAFYGWWDLFNLMTDPQTPAMLQKILAVL